ncbi:MAG: uroporphyrinogen-III C-methyltransferase [Deltaproteobacteria bacterium]|uniref:uroporphyrinogen-III C-methyltransferase n=1 Tax=Candidatus Zymogenus saltonus TaxID=2844893 RepID=A0A9D8KDC5_9DELT|nr:uroporphyrinogen-III C-methyltransferase [Candidatus Zymogenus saltonus]
MDKGGREKGFRGVVYFVGAGPGDPGLLTLKGAWALAGADVVIYDYLVNKEILSHTRKDAELVYVGKMGGKASMSQKEINDLIVKEAKKGQFVVRLKGGDPFVFGRGGEEAMALTAKEIDYEVIPGVTSATAVPAYAGIPVTHREYASAVAFVTGHEDPTKDDTSVDWEYLSRFPGTIVILMGIMRIRENVDALISGGMDPDTPAGVISWGTTPRQRSVLGDLEEIADIVEEEGIEAPAVMVVGEVVDLAEGLSWFEHQPLFGKKIVVTRARDQAFELTDHLKSLGAEPALLPTIEIVPPQSDEPIIEAIRNLKDYDVVVFTSPNGARTFFQYLDGENLDGRSLAGIEVAVMGPGTARALHEFGILADIMPDDYIAEALAEAIIEAKGGELSGKKMLLFRAEGARKVLPEFLIGAGAEVDDVPAYRTVCPDISRDEMMEALEGADLVTFTSGSTAKNFRELVDKNGILDEADFTIPPAASIGPITTEAAEGAGLKVAVEALDHTVFGLVGSIMEYFVGPPPELTGISMGGPGAPGGSRRPKGGKGRRR